jgi:alpha-1,3-rhamnosyltransferase
MPPLISVVILSYNSSKTIVNTLDSIRLQSYGNIELIVTDDASADDSVALCRQWQQLHGERFVRMIVLTTEHNTGIAANANRGCKAARGEWLKVLAADDLLTPNALSDLISFLQESRQPDIVFSKVKPFGDADTARQWLWYDPSLLLERLSHRQLMMRIFEGNFLPAPSAFIKRKCYQDLGGYEESIPLMEDWPFWIKAICQNKRLAFLDAYTACYRFSPTSVSQGSNWQNDPTSRYYQTQRKAEQFAERCKKKYAYWLWAFEQSLKKKDDKQSPLWQILYFLRGFNPYYRLRKKTRDMWPQLWEEHLKRNRQVLAETIEY